MDTFDRGRSVFLSRRVPCDLSASCTENRYLHVKLISPVWNKSANGRRTNGRKACNKRRNRESGFRCGRERAARLRSISRYPFFSPALCIEETTHFAVHYRGIATLDLNVQPRRLIVGNCTHEWSVKECCVRYILKLLWDKKNISVRLFKYQQKFKICNAINFRNIC